MAKFLVVHPIGKDANLKESMPAAKAIKKAMTADTKWTRTMYTPEVGKLYCEWEAKDAETVKDLIAEAAPDFPLGGVFLVATTFTPEDI